LVLTAKGYSFSSVVAIGSFFVERFISSWHRPIHRDLCRTLLDWYPAGMGAIAKSFWLDGLRPEPLPFGVLLANTNYRTQIQAVLPFKVFCSYIFHGGGLEL
jgi:hypothetical protein